MRTPPRPTDGVGATRRIVLAAAAAALGAGLLAGCGSSGATGSTAPTPVIPKVPLTGSAATATATWATLAMGNLDDPLNTFWQLLTLSGSRWHLTTPPGVASNGGLVATVAPAAVLAGFGPSQDLRFSPLAATVDQGSSWQAGVLPAGLSLVPDALAAGAGGSVALLATAGGTVVASPAADLSTWTPVTTVPALRRQPGPADCRPRSLTAVSEAPDGSTLVGASCSGGGRAGLFSRSSDGWLSSGPSLPGGSSGPTEVVRLDRTPSGTAALVSAGSGSTARLYGMWSSTGLGSWRVSAGFSLGRASLVSTGVTATGGFVIATRGRAGLSAAVVSSTGPTWRSLPPPPTGTTSVAATPTGSYDALVPVRSTLSVYGLTTSGWARVQRLRVDIPYGSSS